MIIPFARRRCICLLLALGAAPLAALSVGESARTPDEVLGIALALELASEGDTRGAAIEFRRLGMRADRSASRGGFFWASAYHYLHAQDPASATHMLDRAEDADPSIEPPVFLLRAEAALQQHDLSSAGFYLESLTRQAPEPQLKALAGRRLAVIRLREGRLEDAHAVLAADPLDPDHGREALDRYRRGRDKNPTLGGLLGIIPGLGYAYAGEYSNALRSLILNSLFLYGMVDTARNRHWGGFAVITFFEITWYSGSIYGGIDASHRYNARRQDAAAGDLVGQSGFVPQWNALPTLSLRFQF